MIGGRELREHADHPEVLAPGQVRVDGRVLARQADPPAHRVGVLHHVETRAPRRGPRPAPGSWPAPVPRSSCRRRWAQQPEHGPRRDLEVHAVQGRQLPEPLDEPLGSDREVVHDGEPSHRYPGWGDAGVGVPVRHAFTTRPAPRRHTWDAGYADEPTADDPTRPTPLAKIAVLLAIPVAPPGATELRAMRQPVDASERVSRRSVSTG